MNKLLLLGALAGLTATVPMTIAMKLMHEQLPEREQYPLPPRLIIEELADAADVEKDLSEKAKTNLSYAGHFAYGAAVGVVYGTLISQIAKPNAANGAAYGLAIWAGSYLGWLPAMHILTPATEHPARRNALMIASHVVYGAVLGETVQRLKKAVE